MEQGELAVCIEGNAEMGDVETVDVRGEGDDVAVLNPQMTVVFQLLLGQVVELLTVE